ncbi:hypothetical protein H1C71_028049, partial [Ictidomys tridecemlineatus]
HRPADICRVSGTLLPKVTFNKCQLPLFLPTLGVFLASLSLPWLGESHCLLPEDFPVCSGPTLRQDCRRRTVHGSRRGWPYLCLDAYHHVGNDSALCFWDRHPGEGCLP